MPESTTEIVVAGTGRCYRVPKYCHVTISQTTGGQCCDLFVFDASDPTEFLSAGHTWVACQRLFPSVGQAFVTNRRSLILTVLDDTTNGKHDMLLAACDSIRYKLLGQPEHGSCEANLVSALAEFDVAPVCVPQPVNLFTNIAIQPDGALQFLPSEAEAGEGVVFRCERDVLLVVSACPQDLTPINHGRLKDLTVTTSRLEWRGLQV